MAFIGMACSKVEKIVMTYIVMAFSKAKKTVVAYTVMAFSKVKKNSCGLHSYGLLKGERKQLWPI